MNATPSDAPRPEKQKKIMIVDDTRFILKVLGDMLQKKGYAVVEADDGEAAFGLYCKENPDLVIMDIMMQNGGIDAMKKILSKNPYAKVIVMSIIGEETIMDIAIKEGAAGYLIKPLKEDKVLEAVKNALEG